jgi:hypothetical protein
MRDKLIKYLNLQIIEKVEEYFIADQDVELLKNSLQAVKSIIEAAYPRGKLLKNLFIIFQPFSL